MPGRKRRRHGEGSVSYRPKEKRWRGTLYVQGHPHYVYGKTEKEAVAALDALRAKAKTNEPILKRAPLLAEYLPRWLETVSGNLEPRTRESYASILRLFLLPGLGRVRLDRLQPADIQQFITSLSRRGVAPSRVKLIVATLSSALGHAMRLRMLASNPARLLTLPKDRRPPIRPLTRSQTQRLLAACETAEVGPLVVVALCTGLRMGELLGLRWSDVSDPETGALTGELLVSRQVQRDGRAAYYKAPKSQQGVRTIALPTLALRALTRQRAWLDELRARPGWEEHELVFPATSFPRTRQRRPGRAAWGAVVGRAFHKLLADAGLPPVRFHDLRHGAASLMIASGSSMKEVQVTLGHATLSMTADLYSHLYDEARIAVARRMDTLLSPESGPGSGPSEHDIQGQTGERRGHLRLVP